MSEIVRANIKPHTIERLSRYAKVRLGAGVDDLINDALDTLENQTAPEIKARESRRK